MPICYLLSHGNQLWCIELGYNTLQNLYTNISYQKSIKLTTELLIY